MITCNGILQPPRDSGFESFRNRSPSPISPMEEDFKIAFSQIDFQPEKNAQALCNMCQRPVEKSRIKHHKFSCRWRQIFKISPSSYEASGKISKDHLAKHSTFIRGKIRSADGMIEKFEIVGRVLESNEKIYFKCNNPLLELKFKFKIKTFFYTTMSIKDGGKSCLRVPHYLRQAVGNSRTIDYILNLKCHNGAKILYTKHNVI